MESIEEQVRYGGHCVHGTAIGTPGGADLMCGACEEGYTNLIDCKNCDWTAWTEREAVHVLHLPGNWLRDKVAAKIREVRGSFASWVSRNPVSLNSSRTSRAKWVNEMARETAKSTVLWGWPVPGKFTHRITFADRWGDPGVKVEEWVR